MNGDNYSKVDSEAGPEESSEEVCTEETARKIKILAEREDIPLYEDNELIKMLYSVDFEGDLPPSFFEIINEIFLFLVDDEIQTG